MKIDVLGTAYDLVESDKQKHPALADIDGYCDNTLRLCVVDDFKDDNGADAKGNLEAQKNKNKRHELIHAFLFESGLAENSEWAQNEEMVDWFAMQWPKIAKAIEQAKA